MGQYCWVECNWLLGPCNWCGTQGMCCRVGTEGNGCDGTMGGHGHYYCTDDPVEGKRLILKLLSANKITLFCE